MTKKIVFLFFIVNALVVNATPTLPHNEKGDTTKFYFRHINLNHMSPYFDYVGYSSLTADQADSINHFFFSYYNDTLRSITEVGSDYNWIIHPLLLIGAERIDYSYSNGKITRKYLTMKGEPYPNYKGVYIEEVTIDSGGQKKALKYFDYKGQPMQNIWNISEYEWQKMDTLIVERRKNLKGDYVDVAPYFYFRTSGFKIDTVKHIITHYNLDNNYQVTNSPDGIGSYKDVEDGKGWSYYNSKGIAIAPYGYNVGEFCFDANGSIIQVNYYLDSTLVGYQPIKYDSKGNVISDQYYWDNTAQPLSTNTDILGFSIKNETHKAKINRATHTIEVDLPWGTDLSFLVPQISVANGAWVQPSSGTPVDFSKGYYIYTVIAKNTAFKEEWKILIDRKDYQDTRVSGIRKDNIIQKPE